MSRQSSNLASTLVSKFVKAPRNAVYRAFLDRDALAAWLQPNNMTGHVNVFEPCEGGRFRITLTYQDAEHSVAGKTSQHSDTVRGKFVELTPDTKIVEVVEFDSQAPEFAGEMKIIVSLADVDGGTEVTMHCQDIPPGIRPEDNEQGCKGSLQKLALLLE
jgi:uncharacterized protein YndB with AHSA1/START domain